MNNSSHFLTLVFCLVFLSSCSVEQRIENARTDIMKKYQALPDYKKLRYKKLSWHQALSMLEKNNLELKKARLEVKDAAAQVSKVYNEFIPLIDIGHYYNTALIKSENGMPSYSNFNINIIFNLPALTRLPVEQYTRQLTLFAAEKNLELKRRSLIAKLWEIYRKSDIQKREYDVEDAAFASKMVDPKLKQKEREIETREISTQLCSLLNDYNALWQPVPDTLPEQNWQMYHKKSGAPDELTQTMMALMLESSRLQKLGIALRYAPDVHVDFYSPSLFSMSGGSVSGFMNHDNDVRINLNTYLQIDTRLNIWADWAISKENHKIVQEEISHQMHDYRNKMNLLIDSWKTYENWKQSTTKYITFREQQGVMDAESIQELYKEKLKLQNELLEQERDNIERECALIQEYGLLK